MAAKVSKAEFAALLVAAIDHNADGRGKAEQRIQELEKQEFGEFVRLAADVLADNTLPMPVRQIACILLKNNVFKRRDPGNEANRRWGLLPSTLRDSIIKQLIGALQSADSRQLQQQNAMALSAVACAAITADSSSFNEYLQTLVQRCLSESDKIQERIGVMLFIAPLMDEVGSCIDKEHCVTFKLQCGDLLKSQVNHLLSATINCAKLDVLTNSKDSAAAVRLVEAAFNALNAIIPSAAANFQNGVLRAIHSAQTDPSCWRVCSRSGR